MTNRYFMSIIKFMSKIRTPKFESKYHLTGDAASVAMQSLGYLDSSERRIKRGLRNEYKATRPKLLDYILSGSQGSSIYDFAAPPLPVAVVGIEQEDVSTVIAACYDFAEGNSIRGRLATSTFRAEARGTADYLGEQVASDFGHKLKS